MIRAVSTRVPGREDAPLGCPRYGGRRGGHHRGDGRRPPALARRGVARARGWQRPVGGHRAPAPAAARAPRLHRGRRPGGVRCRAAGPHPQSPRRPVPHWPHRAARRSAPRCWSSPCRARRAVGRAAGGVRGRHGGPHAGVSPEPGAGAAARPARADPGRRGGERVLGGARERAARPLRGRRAPERLPVDAGRPRHELVAHAVHLPRLRRPRAAGAGMACARLRPSGSGRRAGPAPRRRSRAAEARGLRGHRPAHGRGGGRVRHDRLRRPRRAARRAATVGPAPRRVAAGGLPGGRHLPGPGRCARPRAGAALELPVGVVTVVVRCCAPLLRRGSDDPPGHRSRRPLPRPRRAGAGGRQPARGGRAGRRGGPERQREDDAAPCLAGRPSAGRRQSRPARSAHRQLGRARAGAPGGRHGQRERNGASPHGPGNRPARTVRPPLRSPHSAPGITPPWTTPWPAPT